MGKLLEKVGLKIQKIWRNFQCWWNWRMYRLMFDPNTCPNKLCTCLKK